MQLQNYRAICEELLLHHCRLVAVSKTKPVSDILKLYNQGQRIFGENRVQEMCSKYEQLPKDIEWHLIGHLQTNKVKYIAPFVRLIHSVDSLKLLVEIDKQAKKNNRVIDVLLQIFIADEETKFGLSEKEAEALVSSSAFKAMKNVRVCGLMGMATNTNDEIKIAAEFSGLQAFFLKLKTEYFAAQLHFKELSMGMSADYKIALQYGSTYVRIGSMLFGER